MSVSAYFALVITKMILSYAYCSVAVLPLRREPSHRSEQVSQLLFGEKAEILEVDNRDWARIRMSWDDYEGWCKVSQLTILNKREYRKEPKFLSGNHSGRLVFEGSEMWLPLGAELLRGKMVVGRETGKFKGKRRDLKKVPAEAAAVREAALQYLHAPYQWGGRSLAGIDCSGLTQMAYKLCGKRILRDASQQATEGETVDFLQHAVCGDLAFFDNAEEKIDHVGILLDHQTIIHAADSAGKVVIDTIDQGGIISRALRKRTHRLRFVKRML